jgi:uncharacterized membrane protein
MGSLDKFFDLAGSLICHQLPSRSLYAGTLQLPVCARDMGIYAGIFTAALFIILFKRLGAQRPPSIGLSVVFCMMMLPMILDGVLSYAGITESNNTARIFSGMLFGLPIPYFLVPAAHYDIEGANEKPVLKNIVEFLPALISGLLLCILLLKEIVPYFIAGAIFLAVLLFLLGRFTYTIFARIRSFSTGKLLALTFVGTLSVLAFLYLLSAFVFQPLKEVFLNQ